MPKGRDKVVVLFLTKSKVEPVQAAAPHSSLPGSCVNARCPHIVGTDLKWIAFHQLDNMSSDPAEADILSALKLSGYLMEQEVASTLEALGYHVFTSWAFEDSDEGKSREMDVRAIRRVAHNEAKKLSAFVEILVECKNSANPVVFIERPKNQPDRHRSPMELVFPLSKYTASKKIEASKAISRSTDAFVHLGFDTLHCDFKAQNKAVQFCRIDRKGNGWHANHGGLYDAIFYPMAKAITSRLAEIRKSSGEWKYFWFLIPLIVVSGKMFSIDSTKADAKPVLRKFVTFTRELRSQKLNGHFSLEFVRQENLAEFVADCVDPIAARAAQLTMDEPDFVLRQTVQWQE
jgi:hypothetical protein